MWVVGLEKSLEYLSILLGGVQGSVDAYDMLRFFLYKSCYLFKIRISYLCCRHVCMSLVTYVTGFVQLPCNKCRYKQQFKGRHYR